MAFILLSYSAAPFALQIDRNNLYSPAYTKCLDNAKGEHPSVMSCIEDEKILLRKMSLERLHDDIHDDEQTKLALKIKNMDSMWALFVREKCTVILELGGQRGEMLKGDCEVREEIERLRYISEIFTESEI